MSGPRAPSRLRHKPLSTPLKFEEPANVCERIGCRDPNKPGQLGGHGVEAVNVEACSAWINSTDCRRRPAATRRFTGGQAGE